MKVNNKNLEVQYYEARLALEKALLRPYGNSNAAKEQWSKDVLDAAKRLFKIKRRALNRKP